MLDLQTAVRDLQVRVTALEAADAASQSILDAIHELRLDMLAGFGQLNSDIPLIGQSMARLESRIDRIYLRLDKHDGRFDRLETLDREPSER